MCFFKSKNKKLKYEDQKASNERLRDCLDEMGVIKVMLEDYPEGANELQSYIDVVKYWTAAKDEKQLDTEKKLIAKVEKLRSVSAKAMDHPRKNDDVDDVLKEIKIIIAERPVDLNR